MDTETKVCGQCSHMHYCKDCPYRNRGCPKIIKDNESGCCNRKDKFESIYVTVNTIACSNFAESDK